MEGTLVADRAAAEVSSSASTNQQRITSNRDWMPGSMNGPYATIPISSGIDSSLLQECGLPSFVGARREIRTAASEYAARAVALVARAKEERAVLAREFGTAEPAVRRHRARLCLMLNEEEGYLYLCWHVVVKRRGRYTRDRVLIWSCESDLPFLTAGIHPEEASLIRRIEAEATEIRLRWFALVRAVHYMNVTEHFRLTDLEAERIQAQRDLRPRLMQRVLNMLGAGLPRLRL